MRFKLTLTPLGIEKLLPINYQYALSSWIYKVIQQANAQFSSFLHDSGYGKGNRPFKHFTFSGLDIRPFRVHKGTQQIEILGDEVTLLISFWIDRAAEAFIKGLFQDQQFTLGDWQNRVCFVVKQVETLPEPDFKETMVYHALSPVVVTRPREDGSTAYLYPEDPDYGPAFMHTLQFKVESLTPASGNTTLFDPDGIIYDFRVQNQPSSKLITIKPDTPRETRVKGYHFNFRLTAPVSWHEAGYYSGFGEKGSMGFGMGEVVRDEE